MKDPNGDIKLVTLWCERCKEGKRTALGGPVQTEMIPTDIDPAIRGGAITGF